MAHIPYVDQFNDELQTLIASPPPVTRRKMSCIVKAAIKGIRFYKHIVQSVERFISRCTPEYKLPALYVIDAIVRQSIHQYGSRDVYADRFARNLQQTVNELFYNCYPQDKDKMTRVLTLWQRNGHFSPELIQSILDMTSESSNACTHLNHESALSPDMNSTAELLMQQLSETIARVEVKKSPRNHNDTRAAGSASGKIRFNQEMLGFDYEDEDEDDEGDETPTEAEPPLSATLSSIEQEHRRKIKTTISQNNPRHNISAPSGSRQPVLERWNRLIGQRSDDQNLSLSENSANTNRRSRSRTRSRSRSKSPRHSKKRDTEYRRLKQDQPRSRSPSPELEFDENTISDRRKKGLPTPRKGYLTICSSTLWLGHVPKTVSEADISNAFGQFGTINKIDLIPPRGCAYVCMDRRQDAMKALQESRNLKLNNNHIKMAWAPGKGLKDKKFKDYWEVELGASFIPIAKIDASIDLDTLEEGGVVDEVTVDDKIRELREEKNKATMTEPSLNSVVTSQASINIPLLSQPPPFSIPNMNLPPSMLSQVPTQYNHLNALQNFGTDNSDMMSNDGLYRLAPTMIPIPDPSIFSAPPPMFSLQASNQMGPTLFQGSDISLYNQQAPMLTSNGPSMWSMLPDRNMNSDGQFSRKAEQGS